MNLLVVRMLAGRCDWRGSEGNRREDGKARHQRPDEPTGRPLSGVREHIFVAPEKKGLSPRGVWLLLCVSIEDHTKQGLTNVDFGMTGVNMQFL